MKNILKKTIFVFVLIIFSLLKVNALDYNKTYEEAFPDKEFRRLILICVNYNLCDYTTNAYLSLNYELHFLAKHSLEPANSYPLQTTVVDEDLINRKQRELINKVALDKITYIAKANKTKPENIKSLKGIEYLTNLQQIAFEKIGAKEIDFRKNSKLDFIILADKFDEFFESGTSTISTPTTLEKIIIDGLDIKGMHLSLNEEKENSLDLSHLSHLESLVIKDSNLTEIKFHPTAPLTTINASTIQLDGNALKIINLPPAVNINKISLTSQDYKIKIKVNKDTQAPYKVKLKLPVYVSSNLGNHTLSFYDHLDQVNEESYSNYEFSGLHLGENIFKLRTKTGENIKFNATLHLILEEDDNLVNQNNINKNPKTGIKTFGLTIVFILILSYFLKTKLSKKHKYIK